MQNKFSLLITVYNNDDPIYFEEALHSVCVAQSKIPDQLVLVADGPIDKAINDVIKRYLYIMGNSLTFIQMEENLGQGAALNIGLQSCLHELVARMDADDVARPDRFEKQITYMHQNPHIDLSSGYINEFGKNKKECVRKIPLEHDDIIKFSKFRSPINHGACIYKKQKVSAVGGYNNTTQVQDYQLFVDMILAGCQLGNLSEILLDVRINDNYSRKAGYKYFIEELNLAREFLKNGHINLIGFAKNIVFRGLPRFLPAGIVSFIYQKILR